ncbi:MAG: hypothetical protein ACE10D_09680 [Planctomycetota bacterium]|nr:hypothetical protein [Planctomycetota bacterium]
MTKRLFTTCKIVLLFTVILLAAVALGHVADVLDGAEAKEAATKVLWIMGIFAAAALLIVVVSGSGKKKSSA